MGAHLKMPSKQLCENTSRAPSLRRLLIVGGACISLLLLGLAISFLLWPKRGTLIRAAYNDDVVTARRAIRFGVDPNSMERWGWHNSLGYSALSIAASHGNVAMVKMLLNEGANVNLEDGFTTPLIAASDHGHLRVVELLLKAGARDPATDPTNAVVMHGAAGRGNLEVLRFWLDRGVNVNVRDEVGRTPLHRASANRQADIVRFLLANGADREIQSRHYKCALEETQKRIKQIKRTHEFIASQGRNSPAEFQAELAPYEEIVAILETNDGP